MQPSGVCARQVREWLGMSSDEADAAPPSMADVFTARPARCDVPQSTL